MSKQFGIKEVLNYNVVDFATNAPIFYADYATNTSVKLSGDRLDLMWRPMKALHKLIGRDHTKDTFMFKSSLPLADLGRPLQ